MVFRARLSNHECKFCTRTFLREDSRDQHMTAMHAAALAAESPTAVIASTPPATTNNSTTGSVRVTQHNNDRTNPKEHFVIDFVTPNPQLKCANKSCRALGAMPITGLCPSCDPLMGSLVEAANEKAAQAARRSESSLLAQMGRACVSLVVGSPPADEQPAHFSLLSHDGQEYGAYAYDH